MNYNGKYESVHMQNQAISAVYDWSVRIHGKKNLGYNDRHQWIMATAVALANGLELPSPLMEGKTNRVWRASADRLATIKRIMEAA